MAISAFYLHKRSVDQVLDRLLNLRRRRYHIHAQPDDVEFEFSDRDENEETDKNVTIWRCENKFLDNSFDDDNEDAYAGELRGYRGSSSLPNVSIRKNDGVSEESGVAARTEIFNSSDKTELVSSDLPPVRINQSDGSFGTRVGSVGGYAFENTGDSEDEGTELSPGANHDMNIPTQNQHIVSAEAENGVCVHGQEPKAIVTGAKTSNGHVDRKLDATSANITSNDPVFRHNISLPITTLNDSVSVEEQEVLKMIHECLELRERYVFRENVAPWTLVSGSAEVKKDP
ncbi:hypothetical protein CASFOL_032873 [Castilleja foliolosa]|uniref:Uncharacterized protein n=1 Tax=Castilleja foliolosa TaxID=1961234 RepID=A0ABD3C3C9_9LAMI